MIQYLCNHIWHSWHLLPCNLPKIQNKFILIIIWNGDNKTQHSAQMHSHTPIHTLREEERCITMLLEKSDKPCMEWIFRYVLCGDKTYRCDKTCRQNFAILEGTELRGGGKENYTNTIQSPPEWFCIKDSVSHLPLTPWSSFPWISITGDRWTNMPF